MAFLGGEFTKNKSLFARTVNLYLTEAYKRYGIDEQAALEIVAKITGIDEKVLVEAKKKGIDETTLEKETSEKAVIDENLFTFNTSSVFTNMEDLLAQEGFDALDLEGKINAVRRAINKYLNQVISQAPFHYDFYRDFEKDEEDLIQIILACSWTDLNVWDIITYLLFVIESLGKPLTIVKCKDAIKEPFVEDDKIMVSEDGDPAVLFSFIYKSLLTAGFIEKGRILKTSF